MCALGKYVGCTYNVPFIDLQDLKILLTMFKYDLQKTFEYKRTITSYLTKLYLSFRYAIVVPLAEAPPITLHTSHPPPSFLTDQEYMSNTLNAALKPRMKCLHDLQIAAKFQFPELRLIQYDCGKLSMYFRGVIYVVGLWKGRNCF